MTLWVTVENTLIEFSAEGWAHHKKIIMSITLNCLLISRAIEDMESPHRFYYSRLTLIRNVSDY